MPAVTRRSMPAALALAVLVLAACTTGGQPESVTLAELVAEQDRLEDSVVRVEGTVRTYDDPPHSWIEDDEQHRVELFPHSEVEALVGHRVRVEGRFTFEPDRGRGIDIDELEVLDSPPAAGRWTATVRRAAGAHF